MQAYIGLTPNKKILKLAPIDTNSHFVAQETSLEKIIRRAKSVMSV